MYSLYHGMYDNGPGCAPVTFSGVSLAYWERSFFQRATALFDFSGFPEPGPKQYKWDMDAFLYGLFRLGYLCCFRSKTYGILPQPATPYGIGLQYQPTGMIVSTPYFQFDRPLIIGQECTVIKLTPDYRGIWDVITKCAGEMMHLDTAIRQASLNSRFAYAIAAQDEKSAKSAQAIMDRLANGEPGIAYDPKMYKDLSTGEYRVPWQLFDRELGKNYILDKLIEARRMLLSDFYKEIGVRITTGKKERQVASEQEAIDAESYNRMSVWDMVLTRSVEEYNEFFGENLQVEINEWKGGDGYGESPGAVEGERPAQPKR